jgi:hypothetical protein
LWVAQPTFSLIGRGEAVGVLAEMLEYPGGAEPLENQKRGRSLQRDADR